MAKTLVKVMIESLNSGSRKCSRCQVIKPFSEFSKCSRERLGIRSQCKLCISTASKTSRDPVKERERGRVYRAANPTKAYGRSKAWRIANADRCRQRDKMWRAKNPERVRVVSERYYEKVRKDPKFRLQAAVKSMVHAKLKGKSKSNRRTFELLGYTIGDLRAHLERKFVDGMSWDNYCRDGWHIDHIIPLAAHNYESPDHLDFKRAWALSNLQPLWSTVNKSKGAKLAAPFQPSFAI